MFVVHVADFIAAHGALGVFTEQPIEHFHVIHRRVQQMYCGQDEKLKRELVLRKLVANAVWRRPEEVDGRDFDCDDDDDC